MEHQGLCDEKIVGEGQLGSCVIDPLCFISPPTDSRSGPIYLSRSLYVEIFFLLFKHLYKFEIYLWMIIKVANDVRVCLEKDPKHILESVCGCLKFQSST